MKKRIVPVCLCLLLVGLAVLPGCTVGPKYSRPQTPAETAPGYYHTGEHSRDVNDLPDMHNWWRRFADQTTSDLVSQTLERNYDLRAAAARVLQTRATLAQAKGRQLPDVSYNLSRRRNKVSFDFGQGRFNALTTTYQQDFSVAYMLDLFGKLKHAERAAWRDLLAAQANRLALTNSLIAEAVNARVNIATTQRQLAIARANTKSLNQTLDIVERRYGQGLVSPVDVRLARENLAAAKALEPDIELSLITAHHALDILLGQSPGSSDNLPRTLPDLPDIGSVPIGLPASLLDRRPDLIAAESALRAANERVGVSIAQLYPDLTLTGNIGYSASEWRGIWNDETEIYSLLMSVAQPLFKGGQLKAQVDGAKARYAELAADYAAAVLNAMREVEDALITEKMLQIRLEHIKVTVEEAGAAENLARDRYQLGLEKIITVLESERRRRNAEIELALLKGRIWTTRVNLFLALGGDWTAEPEEPEN